MREERKQRKGRREGRERRKAIQPCREVDGAEGAVERGTDLFFFDATTISKSVRGGNVTK